MKIHDWFIAAIVVILALGQGIFAGHKVTRAIADIEIMNLRAQLETANASLAELSIELAFWQNTLKNLAEGGQFAGVDLRGRPSVGD